MNLLATGLADKLAEEAATASAHWLQGAPTPAPARPVVVQPGSLATPPAAPQVAPPQTQGGGSYPALAAPQYPPAPLYPYQPPAPLQAKHGLLDYSAKEYVSVGAGCMTALGVGVGLRAKYGLAIAFPALAVGAFVGFGLWKILETIADANVKAYWAAQAQVAQAGRTP